MQQLRQQGFTLLEVILAMAITAFIAILAYNALTVAINTSEQHEKKAQQLLAIQQALTVLARDIENSVPRAIIDEYGDAQPALMGGNLLDYPLQLTRRGWTNPLEQPRGELQRVRYSVIEQQLWRESWPVLDRLSEDEGLQRVMLIDDIEELKLAFLKPDSSSANTALGGEWVDEWNSFGLRPIAIDVELQLETFGRVRRVFEILEQ